MSRISSEKNGELLDSERANGSPDHVHTEDNDLAALGYKAELHRNRCVYTILFQVLAITAVPFGEGTALTSAIYGGGQLAYFVGWIVVVVLDECVAVSLSELASKFPTSSGPYYVRCPVVLYWRRCYQSCVFVPSASGILSDRHIDHASLIVVSTNVQETDSSSLTSAVVLSTSA